MKKSASILDYSYPFLDPAVWDHDQKLYSYHKDFILRLLDKMYVNYQLKQPEAWIKDIRIIGSLTTSKWLFTSDADVHMVVDLTKFIEINMPGTDPKVAFEFLDATRKEFDRAKILAPMTQHPIEYYFEVPEFITTNTSMVGIYSISQDAWLKEPVIFEADVDFEESKKQVMAQAEMLAEALDGSFGRIDRQIGRIEELENVITQWTPDQQQLFYNKIEEKLKGIEAEIIKDLELRQALIDARHSAQDPMADIEIKFKWLQRFGFFGILTNLKNLMTETGGQVTLQELPLLKKIVTESELKTAFLKEALEKEVETDICVDLDRTIAKPAKYPEIGEPIEGAKEAMAKLQDLGYKVVIYSCRGEDDDGVDRIKEYLDKHDIPYDSIFEGDKPFAKYYIDDHAIKFDNWDNVLKQVEKSEKKASLHVSAKLNQKYWIDPSGKEIEVDRYLGHYGWIYENVFNKPYDGHTTVPQDAMAQVENKAQEMIQQGWTRVTTESDYDFALEVADLSNLPSYLDNFVAQHYTGGGIEIDDLSGEYQDLADPFPSLKKAIYQARRLRNAASKKFSKRDIKAHKYDVLGDPSLRQGQPRAVFNFVQKGLPEFGLPDLDMFDVLGDHPRYGSTLNRKEIEQLGIPITEDKVAKQAKTKKIKQGDYSCIMAMIPHGIAQEIVEFGVREIPDEDLYTDEDGNLGRELQAHVTIEYGLLTDDAKHVRRSFNHSKPFKAKLGKVRHFQPPERDFDVVTVEVVSEDLNEANKMIVDKFECADDLPSSNEYKPHITIAYVKRDAAKKHIGSDEFEGIEVELDTLVFSPRVGNKTYFSIGNEQEKKAEFLPSLTTPAPDNDFQFGSGGDDKEIGVDPDPVSDESTYYAPCTVGKPRTKEVWRQFISMFSNLFSKNDTRKIEAVPDMDIMDPELQEEEKEELGEDQTAHEYSKDFKDLNGPGKPHNTQWFQTYQDQEPSKPLPVTYSPQISNEDNLDQNSPGGYPRRFMGKPKGEWFSNEGEVNNALIQMLKNKANLIDSTTIDITKEAFLRHAYWIDPNGKVFEVRGDVDSDETHDGWIADNRQMLNKNYGINENDMTTADLVAVGWTRIGDGSNPQNWQVQVQSIKKIPPVVDNVLAQFVPEGAQIEFTDVDNDYAVAQYPFKNSQNAVNRALRMSMAASLIKEAGEQSASVPDYLCDEWKTEQIMNDTDEEPYVNHDQRDYPYGMHDSPENTGSGIGWPQDNSRAVVRLDTLENPAFRLDPFGIGEYNVTYYTGMPASDGIEKTNPE